MLTSYPEIRDRIYVQARKHNLRVDWIESKRAARRLLLYDSRQMVVATTLVPLRNVSPGRRMQLAYDLEGVFGEGWMD